MDKAQEQILGSAVFARGGADMGDEVAALAAIGEQGIYLVIAMNCPANCCGICAHPRLVGWGNVMPPSLVVMGFDETMLKICCIASMAFCSRGKPSAPNRVFASPYRVLHYEGPMDVMVYLKRWCGMLATDCGKAEPYRLSSNNHMLSLPHSTP